MCCFCCCCPRPCFRSVFGVCLQTSVLILGFVQTLITIIITLVNAIRFHDSARNEECSQDVCAWIDGELCCPIIKYIGEDAFIGLLSSLFLVIGSRYRNGCLLWSWIMTMTLYSIYVGFFLLLNYSWNKHKNHPHDPVSITIASTILIFYFVGVFFVHSLIYEHHGIPRQLYDPVITSTPLQEQTTHRRPLPPVPSHTPRQIPGNVLLYPGVIPSSNGLPVPALHSSIIPGLPPVPKHRSLPPVPDHQNLDSPPPYKP